MIDKDVAGALNCAEEFFRWMENQPGVSMEDMQIKVLELVMGVEKKGLFCRNREICHQLPQKLYS